MPAIQTRPAPVVDPLLEVVEAGDELVHLVRCRDVSWRRAWCGEESDRLTASVERVCSMCVEEAERLRPGWASSPDGNVCPIDERPCPSQAELEDETVRRTGARWGG